MTPGAYDDTHAHDAQARPAWTTRPEGRTPRARGTRSRGGRGGLRVVAVVRPRWGRSRRTVLVAALLLLALLSTRWFRLNLSASLPRGLYALTAVQEPLARESLVVLSAPASVHPWIPWWRPLLKPVAGLPHEHVCVREERLYIGERDYGPVYTTANGKPLPRLTDCIDIHSDEVFLASPIRGSMDGRYFGPTKVDIIRAQAVPVWTWGNR